MPRHASQQGHEVEEKAQGLTVLKTLEGKHRWSSVDYNPMNAVFPLRPTRLRACNVPYVCGFTRRHR